MSKVIQIEHLSKYYNLGVINNGSLYRDIQTWFALKSKDDPHSSMTAKITKQLLTVLGIERYFFKHKSRRSLLNY